MAILYLHYKNCMIQGELVTIKIALLVLVLMEFAVF